METTAGISLLVKAMAALFPRIVGRFYPVERLKQLLDVQPPGNNEGAVLQYSSRSAWCWLTFSNFSPFVFVIDRLEVKIIVDGASATLYHLLPVAVASTERKDIHIEGIFVCSPEGLALAKKATRIRMEIGAYVTCPAKSFVYQRHIDHVKNFTVNG